MNLWDLPVDRFVNALRFWLLTHVPHDEVDNVVRALDMPPGGRAKRGRLSDSEKAKDAESFEAFAGMLGVRPTK